MRNVRRNGGERVGCVGGVKAKEWIGYLLDDLRAFDVNADQWTSAAQDERKWYKTVEQGAERSMAKWVTVEKARAGLRHAVVCSNATVRTKERIAQIKRARTGSFAIKGGKPLQNASDTFNMPTSYFIPINSGCGKREAHINWSKAALVRNYLEVYCPCAGGLSAVNAIGTQLRDPIISGLTR